MAILAIEVIERASKIAQDETNVRWTLNEWRLWINDALREIALQKPSSFSRTVVLPLEEGTYQALPGEYLALLRVIRNVVDPQSRAGGRVVKTVSRDVLDNEIPEWHDGSAVRFRSQVKHVVFDPIEPRSFWTYPGNDGTGYIEAIVASHPYQIPEQDDPEDPAQYGMALQIEDIYANAVLDFVLYRAYLKDASYAGNFNRAAAHYQQFANSLGIKAEVEALTGPSVTDGKPA